jgi:cell shape-determining protein MreC
MRAGNALSAGAGGVFARFADARALARENRDLRDENDAIAIENRTLAERLADLTSLLGTTTPVADGIAAGVLARPPTVAYDTLIVNGGTDAGIAPGMAAYGPGGVPLGVVTETTRAHARVTLLSAPGMETDAWVGAGRAPIALKGAGGGAFAASVPQGAAIVAGDLVYVAGPGAIPVGRVARINEASSDPAVTLSIRPVANPFSITWILVRADAAFVLREASTTSAP